MNVGRVDVGFKEVADLDEGFRRGCLPKIEGEEGSRHERLPETEGEAIFLKKEEFLTMECPFLWAETMEPLTAITL